MPIGNKIKDIKTQSQIKRIIKQWGQKKAYNQSNMLFKIENHELGMSYGKTKSSLLKTKLNKLKENVKTILRKQNPIKIENSKVILISIL